MTTARDVYRKGLHILSKYSTQGTPIYEDEWDVLIVLDACRVDLLKQVASEYEFIENVETRKSVDTMTPVWMEKTFTEEYANEIADTYYLCSNPASDSVLSSSDFAKLDEIWRHKWDTEIGNVRAESVTRRAITIGRDENPNRLIVHYNQPHWPFIPALETSDGEGIQLSDFGEHQEHRVWERLRRGEISKEEVWKGYRENLSYVLDSVSVLLNNIDADSVVITSDHGNALGEWGIYGHPMHMPVPSIREVPWVETTATDTEAMIDHLTYSEMEQQRDVKEKLRDLGYY